MGKVILFYNDFFLHGYCSDIISGVPPDDLDFATSATIEQLEDMFEDYNITVTNKKAPQHGSFHVIIDNQLIEVCSLKLITLRNGICGVLHSKDRICCFLYLCLFLS